MKIEWERIDQWICRSKVPTGWIVGHTSSFDRKWLGLFTTTHANTSTFYVYDPDHEWLS